MGLFKSRTEKELEVLVSHVEVNMANNYKDAAQDAFRELEAYMEKAGAEGKLSDKVKAEYERILEEYRGRLKGYTHKDQKPYWT